MFLTPGFLPGFYEQYPELYEQFLHFEGLSYITRVVLVCVYVMPVVLGCILLNRYIFKSADMIGGAING